MIELRTAKMRQTQWLESNRETHSNTATLVLLHQKRGKVYWGKKVVKYSTRGFALVITTSVL